VVGFNGHLKATGGNATVEWTIQKAGTAFTLDVSGHVALGTKAALDAHLNIESDSTGLVGPTAIFGLLYCAHL